MRARRDLCLTLDIAADDTRALAEILAAALAAAPIASVTLRAVAGAKLSISTVGALVEIVQDASVAALIADDWELARSVKADGLHVSWGKDAIGVYRTVREKLGDRYIVGADAGRSRDDAMTLGEAGADFVAFGIPAHVEDRTTAVSRQIDLIEWWSEIFEVPAVAFDVASVDQTQALVAAGADFVAVTLPGSIDVKGAAAWMAPFAAAMTSSGKAA